MPREALHPRTEVGQRIVTLRQARGLTQAQLAEQIGVTQQDIAFWERKAPAPRGEVLPKLATILEVSVDELLGVVPPKARRQSPAGRVQQAFAAVSKLPRRRQQKIVEVVEAMLAQHANGS